MYYCIWSFSQICTNKTHCVLYLTVMFLLLGNIFITYSSDVSSEMMPFVDFLTKQGFRPAVS